MAYGEIKVDSITFTANGSDATVSVSGLVQNPTFSGDITVTGTISGDIVQGGTLVSGATVSGTAGEFGTITGNTAGFTTVTGTTVTGTTVNAVSGVFTTQVSGATVTGNTGQFTNITGGAAGFTSVTGTTVTGTTANFTSGVFTTQISGTTITGNAGQFSTLTGGTAGFTTITGTTVTGTTANFVTVSGTTVTGGNGNFTAVTTTTANVTSGVFASGTAGAPSVSVGTTDNGIYSPDTDQVAISTNGTGRLFIDADGDVGVGIASPAAGRKLHVSGVGTLAQFDSSNASCLLKFTNSSASLGFMGYEGDNLTFYTTNTERLRITSDGKVGVGTTSPNRQLQVENASGNAVAAIVSGTGSSSFLLLGDTADDNIGQIGYSNVDNALLFDTNGSERARIDSSGRLGIGTSSPSAKLETVDTASSLTYPLAISNFTNPATDVGAAVDFRLTTGGNSRGYIACRYTNNDASGGTYLSFAPNDGSTGNVERMRITKSGNVGIGTTSPLVNLDIVGSTNRLLFDTDAATPEIKATNAAGSSYVLTRYNAAEHRFDIANSEKARIDSSGRLLVGTSSARANFFNSTATTSFQVEGSGNTDNKISIISSSSSAGAPAAIVIGKQNSGTVGGNTSVTSNTVIGQISFQGNDGSEFVQAALIQADVDGTPGADDMPGRLMFSVTADGSASPSEAMRINNAGELLVGYTSDNGAYKLQVNSQIFATSATIATSDGRYKENVATLDGCVDLVKALRPVSFDWKVQEPVTRVDGDGETVVVREAHNFPDGKQVGFIAQEVEEVLADKPWLGSIIKQNVRPAVTDTDGNELAPEEEFLGIAEGNLVAVLTSALKDAIGRIENLEAEVAALKA